MMIKILFVLLCLNTSLVFSYPSHWWGPTHSETPIPEWEILPEEGVFEESVILSKRNELGILSNFSATPFLLDGSRFASVEGFWQSLKYPEGKKDLRYGDDLLPFSRKEVEQMVGFEAKKAGSHASRLMKKHGVDWVSYQGKKMIYRERSKGLHYKLIFQAMKKKLMQNKKVREVLSKTKSLKLLPDHKTSPNDPPAWKYYQIWMQQRDNILNNI
jgi:predicted NAD-dependent protein-ADP-ribosyltransferase YbiA (DUF1768 family)